MGPLTFSMILGASLGILSGIYEHIRSNTPRQKQKIQEHKKYLKEQIQAHRGALIKAIRKHQNINDFGIVVEDKSNIAIDEFLWSVSWNKKLINKNKARKIVRAQLI